MSTKPGVDDELLLIIGLGELDQEDLRGEVVDVGDSQGHQGGELMGNYLGM